MIPIKRGGTMLFNNTLEDRVEEAKTNPEEMNKLIEEYKPFIANAVQKRTGGFLKYGHDDELTIGMLAFKEAIESYNRTKGKFLSFAKHVINLRMIDYYRKTKREGNLVSLEMVSQQDDENIIDIGMIKSVEEHKAKEENEARRFEILQYKEELKGWEIEFNDLVKASPKQEKLRELYKEIARIIIENQKLFDFLLSKKRLPIKEIEDFTKIHRKKIERGRIYIIALIVAMKGDYTYIKEYANWR